MSNERREAYRRDARGHPILEDSFVLFIDVLGIKELSCRADSADTLVRLDEVVARGRRIATDDAESPWWASSWFSDSLCLSSPIRPANQWEKGEPELGTFLSTASSVQFELAQAGFFMRGGADRGLQFSDDNMTFGPALVRAVAIEDEIGEPCVGLSQSLVHTVREHLKFYGKYPEYAPQNRDLRVFDGRPFINYLEAAFNYVDESLREDSSLVANHRDRIREARAKAPEKAWPKYGWLADYHNDFCRRNDVSDLCLDEAPNSHRFSDFALLA